MLVDGPRKIREGPLRRRPDPVQRLLAFVARERDRQAVRSALPAGVAVHFVGCPEELRPPWRKGPPTAIVVGFHGDWDGALEHTLETLHRMAPRVPVWALMSLRPDAMRKLLHLSLRQLVVDVIFREEDIRPLLRPLLRQAHARSETTAVRRVWRKWMSSDTRPILAACIEASVGAATVEDVARELNKSSRALERLVSRSGLPSAHRVVSLCRLLRAAYRLEQPETKVKTVAAALGYSSPRSLGKHLHRQTGLTIHDLRAGRGFARLAAFVQAELFTIRPRGNAPAHGAARRR
jgi:AraC-like DNA-binding protein